MSFVWIDGRWVNARYIREIEEADGNLIITVDGRPKPLTEYGNDGGRVLRAADEVVPAHPGWEVLSVWEDDNAEELERLPVAAWRIPAESGERNEPASPVCVGDWGGDRCALLSPDGRCFGLRKDGTWQDAFPSIEAWRSKVRTEFATARRSRSSPSDSEPTE
jgi:hypothetical protein